MLCLSACAGTQEASEVSFADIKRDEARIARGAAEVDRAESCGAAEAGADSACDARRALCERVRDTKDADAQTRCLRASDICLSTRARAVEKCAANERQTAQ